MKMLFQMSCKFDKRVSCPELSEGALSRDTHASLPCSSESQKAGAGYEILFETKEGNGSSCFLAVEKKGTTFSRLVFIKKMWIVPTGSDRVKDRNGSQAKARSKDSLRHPNVATVFDVINDDNSVSVVMEYVDGENLDDVLSYFRSKRERLPLSIVCGVALQACTAAHAAHTLSEGAEKSCGLVRGNINLRNLMVDSRGSVKMLHWVLGSDFHQGHMTTSALYDSDGACGTLKTPERSGTDSRDQIYSLGMVLYCMLTGKAPTDRPEVCSPDELDLGRLLPADIANRFARIFARSLFGSPEERYQSVEQMREDIETVAERCGGSADEREIELFLIKHFGRRMLKRRSRIVSALETKQQRRREKQETSKPLIL